MFGFDAYLDLAKTWGDVALTCMTAASDASTVLLAPFAGGTTALLSESDSKDSRPPPARVWGWSGGTAEPRPGSWYRAPKRSPFEPLFGFAWAIPPAAPAVLPTPQMLMPGYLQPLQAWMSLFDLLMPRASTALPINWAADWPRASGWPMAAAPWIGLGFAMAARAPSRSSAGEGAQFAAYRSDSGHAVAQITFPNDVVAAVAVPSGTDDLLQTLFPWMIAFPWMKAYG